MTAPSRLGLVLLSAALVAVSVGCAHRGPDPFVYGQGAVRPSRAEPPACFTGPIAPWLEAAAEHSAVEQLSSRWNAPFATDLGHRVCRGEAGARTRLLEGVRYLDEKDGLEHQNRRLLAFVSGCSSDAFCSWALAVAGDADEPPGVRDLFLEGVRRGCRGVVSMSDLDLAASGLGRTPSTEPPWVTNTQEQRCADFEYSAGPWADMEASFRAGCFDLGAWLVRHEGDREGTLAALERCAEKHEIRYREADCLREMAGLNRGRAVDWLRREEHRGFGMSSKINRYARVLQRFPEDGQLEAELMEIGLIPAGSRARSLPGYSPVLGSEILEGRGRLAIFSPSCAPRYCEHAALVYELADITEGRLDDLMVEERWPALEKADLGDGPHKVATSVGGIPVTFRVADGDDGSATFDRSHHDQLREAVERALEQPHELRLYTSGKVYRLTARRLGEFMDLETVIGGLNTILADRDSEWRLVTLAPHCTPCAQVGAGPADGLIEAAMRGLIEVVDPFHEQWTLPAFDPAQAAP